MGIITSTGSWKNRTKQQLLDDIGYLIEQRDEARARERKLRSDFETFYFEADKFCNCESMSGRLGAHRDECPTAKFRALVLGGESDD